VKDKASPQKPPSQGLAHQVLQPEGWPAPRGYSNGVLAEGRMIFTGGLVGWNAEGAFPEGFAAQVRQTLENTLAVLGAGGAGPAHIVRMTWYVTDIDAYSAARKELGAIWRELLGAIYPPMAVVAVTRLVEPAAMVEIETTAVLPPAERG
jgi:enamine deaminase RidA (YjgF/YER057c/UK114 family)